MALKEPRIGDPIKFSLYPDFSEVWTLGNPEKVIWSSIKHFCAKEVINHILKNTYGISDRKIRSEIHQNVKTYIQQAFEFYEAANVAKPNTAPLIYYYSFLNLAKAICEIKNPSFHKKNESYNHGIRWKPNPNFLVNILTEHVELMQRGRKGVWHILWGSVINNQGLIAQPLEFQIKELFALCPEISDEYERTTAENSKLIDLINPEILIDRINQEIWIKFSVMRDDLISLRLSRSDLIRMISYGNNSYHQVKSPNRDLWTFEFVTPKRYDQQFKGKLYDLLKDELKILNLFTAINDDGIYYSIPIQTKLPILLPQLMVLYTLIFWLGSLVRYDPHSVLHLQESEYWILIEGFMNQSRIWLLELFEWEFYQWETALKNAR
ncbi:MAG: hypothetical protein FJ134_14010 [Deltaproteobacteria bacterium]|nr:hypothetical protein [Deltaproteobacteria bacterium]